MYFGGAALNARSSKGQRCCFRWAGATGAPGPETDPGLLGQALFSPLRFGPPRRRQFFQLLLVFGALPLRW